MSNLIGINTVGGYTNNAQWEADLPIGKKSKAAVSKKPGAEKTLVFFAPGKATGRPQGDRRTAEEIVNANPILKSTPISIPQENMFRFLGDWTSNNPNPDARADAAYNAARLFNYIDTTYQNGKGINPRADQKNNYIDGETRGILPADENEAFIREGTEAHFLRTFSETGYSVLPDHGSPSASENEKNTAFKPTRATGRPADDNRTTEQILNANPIIQRFMQSIQDTTYGTQLLSDLKTITGDWTADNLNPGKRADAAYNLAQVLNYLDGDQYAYGFDEVFNFSGADELTGFLNDKTNPGSEASILLAFSEKGYSALPDASRQSVNQKPWRRGY